MVGENSPDPELSSLESEKQGKLEIPVGKRAAVLRQLRSRSIWLKIFSFLTIIIIAGLLGFGGYAIYNVDLLYAQRDKEGLDFQPVQDDLASVKVQNEKLKEQANDVDKVASTLIEIANSVSSEVPEESTEISLTSINAANSDKNKMQAIYDGLIKTLDQQGVTLKSLNISKKSE